MSGSKPDLTDLKRRMGLIVDKTDALAGARDLLGLAAREVGDQQMESSPAEKERAQLRVEHELPDDCSCVAVPTDIGSTVLPNDDYPHHGVCPGGGRHSWDSITRRCIRCGVVEPGVAERLFEEGAGVVVDDTKTAESAKCAHCGVSIEGGWFERPDGQRFCSMECGHVDLKVGFEITPEQVAKLGDPPFDVGIDASFDAEFSRRPLMPAHTSDADLPPVDVRIDALVLEQAKLNYFTKSRPIQFEPMPKFIPGDPAAVWFAEGREAGFNEAIRALVEAGLNPAVGVLLEYDKTKETT